MKYWLWFLVGLNCFGATAGPHLWMRPLNLLAAIWFAVQASRLPATGGGGEK